MRLSIDLFDLWFDFDEEEIQFLLIEVCYVVMFEYCFDSVIFVICLSFSNVVWVVCNSDFVVV